MSKPRRPQPPSRRVPGVPSSFQLGGATWTVSWVRVLAHGDLGSTDRDTCTISIRDDLSDQVAQATFWHELLHAIEYTRGLLNDAHNEVDIDSRGRLLHQFWLTKDTNA